MKHISSWPLMKRFIALSLFLIVAVSASAQVYYMNVYDKQGNRTRFVIDDLDSVSLSYEQAPISGLKYIDLGLTSGTKWASMNVGATTPFEPGDYFAFGETVSKSAYTRESYKYRNPDVEYGYTKYNFYSNFGPVDNKFRLDPEDDAARAIMGSDWRMPTSEEIQELVNESYWEWIVDTTQLKFTGYKVTGPNGASIYLPVAQYRDDDYEPYNEDEVDALYLSNTLVSYSRAYAGIVPLYLNISNRLMHGTYRHYYYLSPMEREVGALIRPVYSWKSPENVLSISKFDFKEKSVTLSAGETYDLQFDYVGDSIAMVAPMVTVDSEGIILDDYEITAALPGTYTVTACLGQFTAELTVVVTKPQIVAEYVDLGLSVKWATCNVGAANVFQLGNEYAWGDFIPRKNFYIDLYKWYDWTTNTYTKYVTDSKYGKVDNKEVLEAEDDIASVLWGDTWRIPSINEFGELINNCSIQEAVVDGTPVLKFTSLINGYTDKYIILPVDTTGASNTYLYWTSKGCDDRAVAFAINSARSWSIAGERYEGCLVRPVMPLGASDIDTVMIEISQLRLVTGGKQEIGVYGYTLSGRTIDLDGVVWSSDNESVATVVNGAITAVAEGTCNITAIYGGETFVCTVTVFDPLKPEAVDLGLSVKWASFNIGATSPEDPGLYYAWGETTTKDNYIDTTYKWYDVEAKAFTKYNLNAKAGTVDYKYRLDPEDDVAYKVLGEGWRMPTNEEFQELIDSCNWIKTTVNGMGGFLVERNGNSIFLPTTGYKADTHLYALYDYGTYMSSSLNIARFESNYSVLCLEDDDLFNYLRFSGYTVRAVYSSDFADNVLNPISVTLDKQSASLKEGQQLQLDAEIKSDTIEIINWSSSDPSIARVDNTGMVVGLGAGECVISAATIGAVAYCTVTVVESVPLIEAVDLGLSVMWASANVGASAPQDFGGYYAWGETEQKADYSLKYYKWYDSSLGEITKYGKADGKLTLEADDDVAHVKWGGEWRMPTREEFNELFRQCEMEDSVVVDGVMGRTMTGPSGNSIFLPYGGYYKGSTCYYGYGGEYATSTGSTDEYYAYLADYETWSSYKYYGFTVRPVRAITIDDITAIYLDKDTVNNLPGKTFSLNVRNRVDGIDYTWQSTDETVATVKDGVVTTIGEGTCNIVVSGANLTAVCVVNVIDAKPECVNLGLSVNWATFNVGAVSPSDNGDFYAWGETEPKDDFDWSNYKYYANNDLSKYNYDDYKRVLDSDDDVAVQEWGGEWRMPGKSEWSELIDSCNWEWTSLNGVKGYKVTSKVQGYTDNYIFIPAAGYHNGIYWQNEGLACVYWTRTLVNDDAYNAYYAWFDLEGDIDIYDYYRSFGFSVRPVCPNPDYVPPVDTGVITDNISVLVNDYVDGVRNEQAAPRVVTDPSNASNKCIVVTTNQNPRNVYEAQLFVTITEPLLVGQRIELSMKVKADNSQSCDVEQHYTPGDYAGSAPFQAPYFETYWNSYDWIINVTNPSITTYAFDLSRLSSGNNCYFDDISAVIIDTWEGELLLDTTALELTVGSDPYQLTASDNVGTTYNSFAEWTSSNPEVATVDKYGKITVVSEGTATITALFREVTATCTVTVKPYEPVTEFVNLGLSVNWATCNIGATIPTAKGFYFAWGETEYKSDYSWSTYAYCENGDSYSLTKYVYDGYSGYNGYNDDLKKLEAADDAATQIYGDGWRMPTASEFEELLGNCTWELVGNGVKLTSTVKGYTDKFIIIPSTGFMSGAKIYLNSSEGYYWTNSLNTNGESAYAKNFVISSYGGYCNIGSDSRSLGMAIRPVSPNADYVDKVVLSDNITLVADDYVDGQLTDKTEPRTVTDPENPNNQCIVVTTDPNPTAINDAQLYIAVNEELLQGMVINVSMKVKADSRQSSRTALLDSEYNVIGDGPARMTFDTDWSTCQFNIPYSDTRVKTIAISISDLDEGNNCYFDDIKVTVYDYWNGGLNLDESELTLETGTEPYYINAFDQAGYSYNEFVQWTSSDPDVATVNGGVVTPLSAGTTVITAQMRGETATCTVTVKAYEPVTTFVNLGLSVNWATNNIGAATPEGAGFYYAWAETSAKSDYSWDTYKYRDGDEFTKYVTNESSNYYDNLKILESGDDAATQILKGNWRMPSAEEFEELINKCTWTYEKTENGYGYRITSKVPGYTDKSIFLPIGGVKEGSNWYSSYGYYWSRTLDTYYGCNYAQALQFNSWSSGYVDYYERYIGMPIRPVFPNEDYVDNVALTDNITLLANDYVDGQTQTLVEPRVVADPFNPLYKCIVVSTKTDPQKLSDSQLFITVNEKLFPGMTVNISMRMRADKAQYGSTIATLSEPGDQVGNDYIASPSFYTEWEYYSWDFDVTDPTANTYAFNLAYLYEGNNCYFDDISVTVTDNYGGGLSLNETELTLDYGASPYTLSAVDNYGNSFTNYVEWTSSNEDVATIDRKGRVTAKSIGTATITGVFRGETVTCAVTVKAYEPVKTEVDLGLSVNWATCNIGASSPFTQGFYYAWAETDTKSDYSWSTYKYANDDNYTKYVNDDYSEFFDGLTILEPGDDVATQIYGGNWRTATPAEFQELIDFCTWQKSIQNGVQGYLVISNIEGYTDQCIFLPFAGYMNESDITRDSYGYYWTNSLDGGYTYEAKCLQMYSNGWGGGKYLSSLSRVYGMSVRPVIPSDNWKGINSIELSESSISMTQGDYYYISSKLMSGNNNYSFMADGNVTWTSSDPDVFTVDEYGYIHAVSAGEATLTAAYKNVTATCEVTVKGLSFDATGTLNNYGYVDLGLSVNWATFNIGAESVTGLGDYFEWAEVEPYYVEGYAQSNEPVWKEGKDKGYVINSNKYYTTGQIEYQKGWQKYCSDSYYGEDYYEDNLTTLELTDDVANSEWGDSWRMPTADEMNELIQNCSWTWITINGVNGYRINSLKEGYEDRCIFLPSAGIREYSDYYGNSSGFYWSGSLNTDDPSDAFGLYVDSYDRIVTSFERYYGITVRAVCPKD